MVLKKSFLIKNNIETVWSYILAPQTFIHISKPIQKFKLIDPSILPTLWEEKLYKIKLMVLGFINAGNHYIKIKIVKNSENVKIIRDNGHGDLIKKWDHWIILEKKNDKISYTDRIEINAGILTFLVWTYSNLFFCWRQYRLKKIINNNFKVN